MNNNKCSYFLQPDILKAVVGILLILFCTVLVRLVLEISKNSRIEDRGIPPASTGTQLSSLSASEKLPQLEKYLSSVQKQNVFKIYEASIPKSSVDQTAAREEQKPTLSELARGFVLSGIISDSTLQAVIVNTANNKTYFLKEGEYIDQVLVKKVTRDKAVLSYGNEELELRM